MRFELSFEPPFTRRKDLPLQMMEFVPKHASADLSVRNVFL